MTGKISTPNPNKNIKEPPEGNDCVKSNWFWNLYFVWYGCKKAYPSLEVIFEWLLKIIIDLFAFVHS